MEIHHIINDVTFFSKDLHMWTNILCINMENQTPHPDISILSHRYYYYYYFCLSVPRPSSYVKTDSVFIAIT